MSDEPLIKANLNLYAVLRNLPDLLEEDPAAAQAAAEWRIAIQFSVWRGPAAWVAFQEGACTFGRGSRQSPDVVLWFATPGRLNRMMDGKAGSVPLRGFKHRGFMSREFPRVVDRLTFFLKPDDTKLADPHYLALNTQMALATAVFAARELALFDPVGRLAAARIRNGAVQFRVLPAGPAAHLIFADGEVTPGLGEVQGPMACMDFRDPATAGAFLNGRLDLFAAIAGGDVAVRGQTPMIDALRLIFDRIPHYLG